MTIIATNLEVNESRVAINEISNINTSFVDDDPFCSTHCHAEHSWMTNLAYADWLLDFASCAALPNGLQQPCFVIANSVYDGKILNADSGLTGCLSDCVGEG